MLVPVQYRRLMEHPDFDRFDLSSFQVKLSTSAPLRAHVIREALDRWPGKVYEIYGLTEGGVSTTLDAASFPDKLDSVGRPAAGVEPWAGGLARGVKLSLNGGQTAQKKGAAPQN